MFINNYLCVFIHIRYYHYIYIIQFKLSYSIYIYNMNIPYVFQYLCLSRNVDIGGGSIYPPAQFTPLSPKYV